MSALRCEIRLSHVLTADERDEALSGYDSLIRSFTQSAGVTSHSKTENCTRWP